MIGESQDKKFVIDYDMKSVSASLLWTFISSPNGLAEWFADDVEKDGKQFTFHWEKSAQTATQVAIRVGQYIRFRWDDSTIPRSYFEMRITNSDITGSRNLQITDFATDDDDREETIDLWNNQIKTLKRVVGCG